MTIDQKIAVVIGPLINWYKTLFFVHIESESLGKNSGCRTFGKQKCTYLRNQKCTM